MLIVPVMLKSAAALVSPLIDLDCGTAEIRREYFTVYSVASQSTDTARPKDNQNG